MGARGARGGVRILLAPSENKHLGGTQRGGWAAGAHSFEELDAARFQVHAALRSALDSGTNLERVLDARGELAALWAERNRELEHGVVMPALARYSGVVFEHLGLAELTRAQQNRLMAHTLVLCGCFGLLRGADKIPAYRLPIKAELAELGSSLTAYWKPRLAPVLADELAGNVVLDLLPGSYAALWAPRPRHPVAGGLLVRPRIVRVHPGGREQVVSVEAKALRGAIARVAATILDGAALRKESAQRAWVHETLGEALATRELPYGYRVERWESGEGVVVPVVSLRM